MSQPKWGIVGIGRLGRALVKQWHEKGIQVGIYHPNPKKAESFKKEYSSSEILKERDLPACQFLVLALPAQQIDAFITECESKKLLLHKTVLVNMATSLETTFLKEKFPHLTWMGMKFMGHAEDLKQHGQGSFITSQYAEHKNIHHTIIRSFSMIGRVFEDNEMVVEKLNKMATYHAIKAAKALESEIRTMNVRTEYEETALKSIAPEVMRSYVKGDLGHFASSIAEQIDKEKD